MTRCRLHLAAVLAATWAARGRLRAELLELRDYRMQTAALDRITRDGHARARNRAYQLADREGEAL